MIPKSLALAAFALVGAQSVHGQFNDLLSIFDNSGNTGGNTNTNTNTSTNNANRNTNTNTNNAIVNTSNDNTTTSTTTTPAGSNYIFSVRSYVGNTCTEPDNHYELLQYSGASGDSVCADLLKNNQGASGGTNSANSTISPSCTKANMGDGTAISSLASCSPLKDKSLSVNSVAGEFGSTSPAVSMSYYLGNSCADTNLDRMQRVYRVGKCIPTSTQAPIQYAVFDCNTNEVLGKFCSDSKCTQDCTMMKIAETSKCSTVENQQISALLAPKNQSAADAAKLGLRVNMVCLNGLKAKSDAEAVIPSLVVGGLMAVAVVFLGF